MSEAKAPLPTDHELSERLRELHARFGELRGHL